MFENVVLRTKPKPQVPKSDWRCSFQNRKSLWEQKASTPELVQRPYSHSGQVSQFLIVIFWTQSKTFNMFHLKKK